MHSIHTFSILVKLDIRLTQFWLFLKIASIPFLNQSFRMLTLPTEGFKYLSNFEEGQQSQNLKFPINMDLFRTWLCCPSSKLLRHLKPSVDNVSILKLWLRKGIDAILRKSQNWVTLLPIIHMVLTEKCFVINLELIEVYFWRWLKVHIQNSIESTISFDS